MNIRKTTAVRRAISATSHASERTGEPLSPEVRTRQTTRVYGFRRWCDDERSSSAPARRDRLTPPLLNKLDCWCDGLLWRSRTWQVGRLSRIFWGVTRRWGRRRLGPHMVALVASRDRRPCMRRKVVGVVGVLLFGSFGALSGAFANTQQEEPTTANQRYECTVKWKAGSEECKSRGTTASCTSKYQGDHASAAEAKERCEFAMGVHLGISGAESCDACSVVNGTQEDPVERCKKACDVINRICIARCRPRNYPPCMDRCNQDTAACYRDCQDK